MEVSIHAEGSLVRLFGSDGEPKIQLATQGDSGALIVGDPERDGVAISVNQGVLSELRIMKSGKHVALAIDDSSRELRFVNAQDALTNKIYVTDEGGQIGLSDHEDSLSVSAGEGSDGGGVFHILNKAGNTVAALDSNGAITLLDEDGDIRIMIGHKGDGHIHLVDKDGHIVWTTIGSAPSS